MSVFLFALLGSVVKSQCKQNQTKKVTIFSLVTIHTYTMMAMPSGAIYGFSILPKVMTTFRLLGSEIEPPILKLLLDNHLSHGCPITSAHLT